jgi:hypothetical protein
VTFKDCQDRVMARHNLTTTEARTRIKQYINERTRHVQTSTNIRRVRRGTVSIPTVIAAPTLVATGVARVLAVSTALDNRVLEERTLVQLRLMDPNLSRVGDPQYYAVNVVGATAPTLRFQPIPNRVLTLTIDGMLLGTEMTADGDIPGFPEDFHNALIFGASADEYDHQEKADLLMVQEQKFERRLSDLKYWMATSAFLEQGQRTAYAFWHSLHA